MAEKLSKKQTNYIRLMLLVLQVGKEAVQIKFDEEFHPTQLQNEINRNRPKLQNLKGKVIKDNQWKLLYPINGQPLSSTFDISLMITLLRNLTTGYNIQDGLPTAADVTVSSDLSRIKYYRNMLAHSNDAELPETEFEMKWRDLSEAVIRLGGKQLIPKCKTTKDAILDSSKLDIINEVRKDLNSMALPDGIEVIREAHLKEWEDCEDLIVETRACRRGVKLVKRKDVVIVSGPPGSGKTAILGHICQGLHRQSYIVIPCRTPDEIIHYYNSDKKQLFLFDDVVGSFVLDVNLLNKWKTYSADLTKLVQKRNCKILVATRSYIHKDRRFSSIPVFNNYDFSATLDLLSKKVCLLNIERFHIAKKYMDADVLRILKEQDLLDIFSFFPLLCKRYHERKENLKTSIDMFFTYPTDIMLQELEGFMNEPDETVLAVLFIFVTSNNTINVDKMNQNEFKDLLNVLVDNFEIHHPLTRQRIISHLDRMTSTFVKKSHSMYSMVHEKLFDILVYFYGKYKLDLLIKYGHTIVIRDRFEIKHNGHQGENITQLNVEILPKTKRKYFERLKKEIRKKSGQDVFRNKQWKCTKCLSSFIEYLKGCPDIVEYLRSLSDSNESPVNVAIEESLDPLLQFFKQIGLSGNVRHGKSATLQSIQLFMQSKVIACLLPFSYILAETSANFISACFCNGLLTASVLLKNGVDPKLFIYA